MCKKAYDYLIVGAGIIGLTIAYQLKRYKKDCDILIIEKEEDVAIHASGRNSGVLHAGFYYTSDSLKAKFTSNGNKLMKEFCQNNNIPINMTQKVVVAKDENELAFIDELYNRGIRNGVDVSVISEDELSKIDSNAKTYKKALFAPSTASVNPKEVCCKLRDVLTDMGVKFLFSTSFKKDAFGYRTLINCAGLYADKIAKQFGIGKDYTMIPFKGIYYKYKGNGDIKTNIYPVPNLNNPFLGVHFTITSKNEIKIGPTAIPAFWRENYQGLSRFNFLEFMEIFYYEAKLFVLNAFNFRKLAMSEIKKYRPKILINEAKLLVHKIGDDFVAMPSGIRAQLLNTKNNELVQDFAVEYGENSVHILNAVSPAFTCSFAFADFVVKDIIKREM